METKNGTKKSAVAKNKGKDSPSSPGSVEAELYANVRVNLFYLRRVNLAFRMFTRV